MDLIELLNELGEKVNKKIKYINSGGCCVFAAEVAQQLQAVCPVRIVVGTPYSDDADEYTIDDAREQVANNTPREWNNYGVRFGHVVVEFDLNGKTYHYDSNGVSEKQSYTKAFGFTILKGSLSVQEATEIASYVEGWNDRFDRDQIPKLQKMIKKSFDKPSESKSPSWTQLLAF